MNTDELRFQYADLYGRAERMRGTVFEQLSELLDCADITLGVPIESRVKSWSSIEEKIERKSLSIDNLNSLPDLVGIRTILLFRTDLGKVDGLINKHFDVISSEDTSKRLGESQFGYQSQHYVLKLPASWLAIPTMTDLGDLQIEVQVRTLAQHIWAAASHKLQYKHESSVPPPLRRTMNRVSALLETVDLEFERVLSERKRYQESGIARITGSEPLNVDLLASILDETFPSSNRTGDEDYESLLSDLSELSVKTASDLKSLLSKHRDATIYEDQKEVKQRLEKRNYKGTTKERIERGVFYTHTGLVRTALRLKYGLKASAVFRKRAEMSVEKKFNESVEEVVHRLGRRS